MRGFSARIAPAVTEALAEAVQARRAGQVQAEFACLERAHVLGQASTYWHVLVHVRMLSWAWRNRRPAELWGQLLRIVGAAALTAVGLVPEGNTGGANVSPVQPMAIAPELAEKIRQAKSGGDTRQ